MTNIIPFKNESANTIQSDYWGGYPLQCLFYALERNKNDSNTSNISTEGRIDQTLDQRTGQNSGDQTGRTSQDNTEITSSSNTEEQSGHLCLTRGFQALPELYYDRL